jgi:hypothetical protein
VTLSGAIEASLGGLREASPGELADHSFRKVRERVVDGIGTANDRRR